MPTPKNKAKISTTNSKNTKKGSSYSRSDKAYKDVSKQKAKKELEKAKLNYTETKYDTKHVPTQKKYRAALTEEQAKGISKTVAQRKKRVQAVQSYGESVRNRGRAISAFTKQYPAKKRRPGQFD